MTEGSNFYGIWKFAGDTVDVNQIRSNDIYAILMAYGVEAARSTIVNEIQSIFGAYGISVDARHTELIADYMVCTLTLTLWFENIDLVLNIDVRWRVQAIQPERHIHQQLPPSESQL